MNLIKQQLCQHVWKVVVRLVPGPAATSKYLNIFQGALLYDAAFEAGPQVQTLQRPFLCFTIFDFDNWDIVVVRGLSHWQGCFSAREVEDFLDKMFGFKESLQVSDMTSKIIPDFQQKLASLLGRQVCI